MRYQNAATIVFTDANGKAYPVKDNLPVHTYQDGAVVATQAADDLDEICSRVEYYGEGSENLGYAIVDKNIIKMFENNFDAGNCKSLILPVIV